MSFPQFSDKLFEHQWSHKEVRFKTLDTSRGNNGVEFPKEGGMLTYFKGEKQPWKGFMSKEPIFYGPIDALDTAKTIVLSAIKFLTSKPFRYFLPIFLSKRIRWSALAELTEMIDAAAEKYYLKPKLFCTAVREIWRVFNPLPIDNYKELSHYDIRTRTLRRFLMFACMTLEFDDYYRLAVQDGLSELNKENLKKNPAKELIRIIRVIKSRDKMSSNAPKWQTIERAIWLGSKVFGKEFKKITNLIGRLDLEKIKLDGIDWYHCLIRSNYDFKGIPFHRRYALRQQIDRQWKQNNA